jgi:polyhydroxyalkanoate synthesis regulator phasin
MKARYAEYEQRLDAAVARGELTAEEAKAKLAEARKKMFGDQKARKLDRKTRKLDQKAEKKDAAREKRADDGARAKGAGEGAMKARYAEYEKRLDAAVARGELTAEEAKAKLAEARKKMFGE